MIRSADDKMSARTKHLLRETKQVAGSNEVLDHLRRDGHIKALVANSSRIVVYSDLVEHQLGRRTLREPNPVRARLAANHFVTSARQFAAQCAVPAPNIDDAMCGQFRA